MSTTVCVECNCEISAANGLCPECGFPAEPGQVSCPECLNLVLLSQDSCPECGFPLEELQHSQAEARETPVDAQSADTPPIASSLEPQAVATHSELAEKRVAVASQDLGRDPISQALEAQTDSFNELSAVIGKLVENSSSSDISELVVSIRKFVNNAENTNNDMLCDLITNIGRFVESSEKIKDELISTMKEQNLTTTNAMQEIVASFSREITSAAALIQGEHKATLAEMNSVAQQVKAAAVVTANSDGNSEGSSYVLYACAILAVFTILNFFVTAYVVRLVK